MYYRVLLKALCVSTSKGLGGALGHSLIFLWPTMGWFHEAYVLWSIHKTTTSKRTFIISYLEGNNLRAYHRGKGWEDKIDTTKSYLDSVTKWMKKFMDHKRYPMEYQVGDMVIMMFNPRQFMVLWGMHQNLFCKYDGPFRILSKVEKI